MSLNEEFDELARRKLEERAFPFQEADWQDARKLIEAERGGRNRAVWITGAIALLLISGSAWYGMRTSGTEKAVATIENDAPSSVEVTAMVQSAQNEPTTSMIAPSKANEQASAADVMVPSIKSIPVHSEDRAPEASTAVNASAVESIARKGRAQNRSGAVPATMAPTKKNSANNKQIAVSNEGSNEAINPAQQAASISEVQTATTSAIDPANNGNPIGSIDPKTEWTTEGDPNASSPISGDQPKARDPRSLAMREDRGNEQVVGAETKPVVPPTKTDDGTNAGDPRFKAPTEAPVQPTAEVASFVTDTTTTNATANTLPVDSANAAAAVAPAPPPLVPERAPWEVSALGGMFSSKSNYSGGNSADWTGNISNGQSFNVGAELMHMGRNVGIGTGLHYGSYAERIRTDAIDVTSLSLQNYWYLMPEDTMILVITDTIPGTPPTYSGTSENTTVNVLTQGTDTTVNTQHLRDSRDQVNRVSYLEVPILLDAHLTQGRWMLGLRGGPTIGLLTGRRGSLPNPTDDGYVPLTDQAFREVVFGYTARAYVRYRFNAGWSVGLEPATRGQLFNSLGNGDLERRSSALGVMMSLTYRLR